jgi:hypothetical protein
MSEEALEDDGSEQTDQEYQNYLENGPLADAWAEFVMNGQPKALARYLKLGGQVDDLVRQALIEALKDDPRGEKGGRKPFRDWQTFVCVEHILRSSRDRRLSRTQENTAVEKQLSQRQALQKYADKTSQELRAVERQYDRGAKVSKEFK